MCARFSDEDVGKTVYNAADEEVGIVSEVEHGTAHVEPDPGITDTISAKLGWGDAGEGAYPLQEDSVESVTDDAIHLKGGLGGGETATHAETDTGTGTRSDDGTDMKNDPPMRGNDDTRGSEGKVYDDDHSGRTDDDDSLIGDDDSRRTDDDDSLIGDDDSGRTDDDDSLIGDDDDSRRTDDDSLIGDDDDSGLMDDDDSLIGDDDDEMSDGDRSTLGDSDDDDDGLGN